MHDFINVFKLIWMSKNAKSSIIIGTFCTLLGTVMTFVQGSFISSLLLIYGWMFVNQFIAQLEASKAVGASPMRRKYGFTYQNIINGFGAAYAFILINLGHKYALEWDDEAGVSGVMFLSLFIIYFGMSYKIYGIATAILIVIAIAIYIPANVIIKDASLFYGASGLAILTAAYLISVILKNILYKLPLSDFLVKSLERQAK